MDTNRLEAFTDGVTAIAITLLVLEIAVPEHGRALGPALLALWPSYVAYVVSFLVIGAIWINHHAMFRHIARADHVLLLLNVLHLMVIAFLPFPTAVLASAFSHGSGEAIAAAFYGATLTVLGVLINGMWWYAAHGNRLLDDGITADMARRIGRHFLVGPLGYAVATIVAIVVPPAALGVFFALNVFYRMPRKGVEPAGALGRP